MEVRLRERHVPQARSLERTVHGHPRGIRIRFRRAVGRIDQDVERALIDLERIRHVLTSQQIEVLPREGERVPKGVCAADAEIIFRGPHSDVVKRVVIERDAVIAHNHAFHQPVFLVLRLEPRGCAGELGIAVAVHTLASIWVLENRESQLLLVGECGWVGRM